MTLFIAADHRGFELKNQLLEYFQEKGIRIEDLGNYQYDAQDDYPDFAQRVAQAVLQNLDNHLGIAICGSGCGVVIAVNRFPHIRAGLAMNEDQAKHIRENDHANVIALAADYISFEQATKIIDAFLSAQPKTDEKYLRRIKKIEEFQNPSLKQNTQSINEEKF